MNVVLVTGAGHGIGQVTARTFAAAGWRVAVNDILADEAEETVRILGEEFGRERFLSAVGDLAHETIPGEIVARTAARFGRIDCIVSNAAYQPGGGLSETTTEIWDRVQAVNVRAPFLLARAALTHLMESRGSLVHIGSLVGGQPLPDRLAYSVSKAALSGLTRALATDLGPHGVRVNAIAPGHIMTHGEERWKEHFTPREQRIFPISYPLARVGHPEEIASVALFLASDAASFITGATIPVDGGMSVLCPETIAFRAAALAF